MLINESPPPILSISENELDAGVVNGLFRDMILVFNEFIYFSQPCLMYEHEPLYESVLATDHVQVDAVLNMWIWESVSISFPEAAMVPNLYLQVRRLNQ